MIVGVSCGGVATLCFHLLVREDTSEVKVSQEEKSEGSGNPGVVSWLLNPNLYFVACVYMATRLYVNLTQAYIPFYLQVMNYLHFFLGVIYLSQFEYEAATKSKYSNHHYREINAACYTMLWATRTISFNASPRAMIFRPIAYGQI